jgi:putative two-component system response regulator
MFEDVTILAVDDDILSLAILEGMLSEQDCRFLRATNGQQALDLLESDPHIDVVLLDLEMPVMDGKETLKLIKQSITWRDIPVIVLTSGTNEVVRSLALGANDFIAKPCMREELRLRVMNHVRSKKLSDLAHDMNSALEGEVARKTAALQKALSLSREAEYEISLRLGRAAEFRDQETGRHTQRISELSKKLAGLAGLPDDQCEVLRVASPLHDVGKIGIPDSILLKPGKLDQIELDIMKMHTTIGGKILSEAERFPLIEAGSTIALQHHEKWDGSGYPSGMSGEDIHVFARIVSIVDVFDALTSDRPYKKAFSLEKTTGIMLDGKGSYFDPHLLDLFFANFDQFVTIKHELGDVCPEEISDEGIACLAGNL